MLLNYFVVDTDHQLRRVERELVEEVWCGARSTDELGHDIGDQLRVVSVLSDDADLQPQICFFVRAEVRDGSVTDQSRIDAYEAMTVHQKRAEDTFPDSEQFEGWPDDWQRQLAIALDVPAIQLQRVGVGGPLLMSDLWGYPIDRILEYFEEASERAPRDNAE